MSHALAFSALIAGCLSYGVSAADTSIALRVTELAGADRDEEIVTSGVPLSRGTLTDVSQSRLLDADGNEVPFVGTVLARWPDGSVKWLLLDFRASVGAGQTARSRWIVASATSRPANPERSSSTTRSTPLTWKPPSPVTPGAGSRRTTFRLFRRLVAE